MKKLLLLLLSGTIYATAVAQERTLSVMPASQDPAQLQIFSKQQAMEGMPSNATANTLAHKTTTGGSRYYNYAFDYVDTTQKIASGVINHIGNFTTPMWQDTNMVNSYSGPPVSTSHLNLTSIGAIFDPHAASFNDSTFFTGLMKVTTGNAYVVDSVFIFGVYKFNPAKTTIVDTVRLSFVKGNGGSESTDDIFSGHTLVGGHYPSLAFYDMHYDSVKNYARNGTAWGTVANDVYDIILKNTDWADTNVNGIMTRRVALPTPLSVPAGGYAGVSISFISGDPAISTTPNPPSGGDTIKRANNTYKFNSFQPLVSAIIDNSTPSVVQWAPAPVSDHNAGYFKTQPSFLNGWTKVFIPQFGWTNATTGGAYFYQYPDVTWHVTCATCGVITNNPTPGGVAALSMISKADAYPNPATDELNVPFTLSQGAHVVVSLTNMVGQVVASQDMGIVASGKAVFDTKAIPAGVYFCTILANTERNTSKIIITH